MLKERNGWFYYRKRISRHLRPAFQGKHELVVALKTRDLGEAKVRVLRIAHEAEKALQRAREQHRALVVNPDALAKAWRTEALRVDREDRIARPRDEDTLLAEVSALEDAVQDADNRLRLGDTRVVQEYVREVLERHRIALSPADERRLAHALLVENALTLNTILERASGTWRGEQPVKASPTVSQVLEAWLRERNPPSKTAHEVRATFARFAKVALDGEDRPITDVTKEDVRRYRGSLLGESSKTGQGTGALAPATAKKYLTLLGTVFKYAVRTGLIDASPVEGMSFIPRGKSQERQRGRLPFPVEDVSTLLGALKAKAERSSRASDETMWRVALILFHSGMRLEEAGGLRGRDIQQREGVWGFSIEPGEERSLKTETAQRFVPLHPVLLKSGLVKLAKERGEGWLFPLKADRHGKRTSALSKAFGRLLRSLKLDRGGRVVMHSARHTVTDRLRAAGTQEALIAALLGHAHPTMTARYGRGWDVKSLATAVASITYPGVRIEGEAKS